MNSFQIHDADGKAIPINLLDAEAAAFWGKEVHKKDYANPSEPRKEGESELDYLRRSMTSNWFDVIGWCIGSQKNYTSGWRNVVHNMIADSLGDAFVSGKGDEPIPMEYIHTCVELRESGQQVKAWHLTDKLETSVYGTMLFYKPFIELINHWQSKGYKPVKINEN